MVIVLIHWKILPEKVHDFLHFWQREATVKDRQGLIGEFLSEVREPCRNHWITWDLTHGSYLSYVNVGLWRNDQDFHKQVAQYFNDSESPKHFEAQRRVRTVIDARHWRIGKSSLPGKDSDGVL